MICRKFCSNFLHYWSHQPPYWARYVDVPPWPFWSHSTVSTCAYTGKPQHYFQTWPLVSTAASRIPWTSQCKYTSNWWHRELWRPEQLFTWAKTHLLGRIVPFLAFRPKGKWAKGWNGKRNSAALQFTSMSLTLAYCVAAVCSVCIVITNHLCTQVFVWYTTMGTGWKYDASSLLTNVCFHPRRINITISIYRMGQIKRGHSQFSWISSRAAVGMEIPMGIPMGMGIGWVWGLWWIPMGLWEFCGDFWMDVRLSWNALNMR